MKRIRIIAVIAALATAFALYLYLSSMKKPEAILRVPVVVAVKEIPEGIKITADMVTIKELPQEAIVSNAASRLDVVVGLISSCNVQPDEQILGTKVFKAGETKSGLAFSLDKGMRAFTVPVDQVTGVAGFIQPKDHVDLLVITDLAGVISAKQFQKLVEGEWAPEKLPGGTPVPESTLPPVTFSLMILQNIKVLAVGQVMKSEGSDAKPAVAETVTLAVTPEQALKLNLASKGNIRLVLRPANDDSKLIDTIVANLINISEVEIDPWYGPKIPPATSTPEPTPSPKPTPEPTNSPKAAAGAKK